MDYIFTNEACNPLKHGEESQAKHHSRGDSMADLSSDGKPPANQEQYNCDSIAAINHNAREVVEKINKTRSENILYVDEEQQSIAEKFEQTLQMLRGHVSNIYERNNDVMRMKLEDLSAILERCSKESADLREASKVLDHVRDVMEFIVR